MSRFLSALCCVQFLLGFGRVGSTSAPEFIFSTTPLLSTPLLAVTTPLCRWTGVDIVLFMFIRVALRVCTQLSSFKCAFRTDTNSTRSTGSFRRCLATRRKVMHHWKLKLLLCRPR